MRVIAVDPGDKHVGVAVWSDNGDREAYTVSSPEAVDHVRHLLEVGDEGEVVLVIEEFRLYPGKDKPQAYSQMETSEMIGALKYVARRVGVEVVEQGAYIKTPTRKQLQARGIVHTGDTVHAKDAELHLIHYCLKEGKWKSRELL